MKRIILLLVLMISLLIKGQTGQWQSISNVNFQQILHGDFYNDQLGIAVEDNKYHLTKDGGQSWKTVFSPGLEPQDCEIFANQTDTLFVITSLQYNKVYTGRGFNDPLTLLDSNNIFAFPFPGKITSIGNGGVVYVTGSHGDTSMPAGRTILETHDLGLTWSTFSFPEMSWGHKLLNMVQRGGDTMVLLWETSNSTFIQYRVDTLKTVLIGTTSFSYLNDMTCQSSQCIFDNRLLHKGSVYSSPHWLISGSNQEKYIEFFDVDEFVTLSKSIKSDGIADVYVHHLKGDSIDKTSHYQIGPDYAISRWKGISVTDNSVFLIGSRRIYKRDKYSLSAGDFSITDLSFLKVFNTPDGFLVEGLETGKKYNYQVFNMAGAEVFTGTIDDRFGNVKYLSTLSRGIYVLYIQDENGRSGVFKIDS